MRDTWFSTVGCVFLVFLCASGAVLPFVFVYDDEVIRLEEELSRYIVTSEVVLHANNATTTECVARDCRTASMGQASELANDTCDVACSRGAGDGDGYDGGWCLSPGACRSGTAVIGQDCSPCGGLCSAVDACSEGQWWSATLCRSALADAACAWISPRTYQCLLEPAGPSALATCVALCPGFRCVGAGEVSCGCQSYTCAEADRAPPRRCVPGNAPTLVYTVDALLGYWAAGQAYPTRVIDSLQCNASVPDTCSIALEPTVLHHVKSGAYRLSNPWSASLRENQTAAKICTVLFAVCSSICAVSFVYIACRFCK